MILAFDRRRPGQGRRSAFTLLEVLVVVAILVVLATVASVQIFRYLDDAKKDKAYLQAQNIAKAAKAYIAKQQTDPELNELQSLIQLITPNKGQPFLEGGSDALKDPWGQEFQVTQTQLDTGDVTIEVYTICPKDQERISSLKKRS